MVEEPSQNLNPNPEQPTAPLKFEDVAVEEPAREVVGASAYSPQSVTEAEESTPSKSDIRAVVDALTPKFSNKRLNELLQPTMVSRIFPDNYIDKMRLLAIAMIEEMGPDPVKCDPILYISNVQDACSIAFEGRHIIDLLEVAGVVHEEEMQKIAKDTGLL